MRRSNGLELAFIGVWTSGYVVGTIATRAAPPLAVNAWRMGIAAGLLAGIAALRRDRWPRARDLAPVAVAGILLLAVQFGGFYLALGAGLPAATVSLVASCTPVLVGVTGAVTGSEPLSPRQWLGAALGLAGVVAALSDHLSATGSLTALLCALVGLTGSVSGTLAQRRLPTRPGLAAVASLEAAVAAIVLAPVAALHGGLAIPLHPVALTAIAWLALVGSATGSLILFTLIRRRGATRASALLFCIPATVALASWPILGQAPSVGVLAGLLASAVGVTLMYRQAPTPSPATTHAEPETALSDTGPVR
ncbi:MAG: DMT family transporter [Intrasporangium sp.]|uniref:DMT family transporter n=1 Tax=Intrasporangium sp. TaxID=1925024 RepID=UPI00264916E9|nr:DMT family transporter [Intrasporangium sp.]MDN5795708.1 DMT family transporter [Intrasporangium sp.]